MYSIGKFLCTIQTNRWAFAFCASLGPGFLVGNGGKKLTSEASRARDLSSSSTTTSPPPTPLPTLGCLLAILNEEPVNRLACERRGWGEGEEKGEYPWGTTY